MSQKVEKVQKGREGSAPEIKKSTIQNVDFLISFLGNFKCFKLMFLALRGGSENSKFSQFQIFPKLVHLKP